VLKVLLNTNKPNQTLDYSLQHSVVQNAVDAIAILLIVQAYFYTFYCLRYSDYGLTQVPLENGR